jgi:predicted metal-dependent phosphoesterase TrpH
MTAGSPAEPRLEEKAGYAVLAVDFHVHSFPGDGVLPPWDIAVEARRRRLDAVALTNHNSTHSWRLAQWLSGIVPRTGAMLIPGEELTSNGYHLAVVGVTAPIDWRQPAASAAAATHAAGGVAIAAHPSRRTWRSFDDAALLALDGVEVGHPSVHVWADSRRELAEFYERAVRVHPSIAAIGSTDFHHLAPLGLGRTYVFARPATQAGILDAVRAGRTVACDGRGEAYGPPELVAMTREDCRRDANAPPEGETPLNRAGTWLIWIGLVALVVLGAEKTS